MFANEEIQEKVIERDRAEMFAASLFSYVPIHVNPCQLFPKFTGTLPFLQFSILRD